MAIKSPKDRSEEYVQFLEEKCVLLPEVPEELRPAAFKKQIEDILVEMEVAEKNLKRENG